MIVIMDGGQHAPPRKKCGPGYHSSSKKLFRKRQALVRRFIFSSLQGEDCLIYQSPRQSKKLAS